MDDFGPFAIALKEVTVMEFVRFRKLRHPQPGDGPNYPAGNIAAYEAEEYCLWLDEQEGLDKRESCYVFIDPIKQTAGYRLKPGYRQLKGYRLPTEAEWEYACQNAPEVKRYLARNEDVLREYGWYRESARNRLRPVGSLKPSRFGLFDWQGNVAEWCADRHVERGESKQVYHGLSFNSSAGLLATLPRGSGSPSHREAAAGVRVARSLPWTQ